MRQLIALVLLSFASVISVADDLPVFKLSIQNGRFNPETLKVPAGKKFKIMVTNLGPGPEEFDSTDLRKETVMGEGVTRPIVVMPLKPGSYSFIGEFHPQTAKGKIIAK